MKTFLKIIGIFLLVIVVLVLSMVRKIDRTPFQEQAYYSEWQAELKDLNFAATPTNLQIGWAKINMTPDQPYPMAGYGDRWGAAFEGVHDSLYVRAISLLTDQGNVTFVSADLLIVPIDVRIRLEKLLEADGISRDEIHLGATHTHHSIGGWGKKLLGRLFAGKYHEEVEVLLAERFREAILASRKNALPGEMMYVETTYEEGIKNRLKVEDKVIDPEVRSLLFTREDGSSAVMLVNGAHSIVMPAELLELSRDYPGHVVDSLEAKDGINFALFYAGAVGSMGYRTEGDTKVEQAGYLGGKLADQFVMGRDSLSAMNAFADANKDAAMKQATSLDTTNNGVLFLSKYVHVPLPDPTPRISINYALRTWVFNGLFGTSPGEIKVTLIGNTLMLGMPADFSGEIMKELDDYAAQKGIDLIVTSFNGNYIGYVTHDKHYEHNLYETVTMSWFGYQIGGYYTQVSKDIIDQVAKTNGIN